MMRTLIRPVSAASTRLAGIYRLGFTSTAGKVLQTNPGQDLSATMREKIDKRDHDLRAKHENVRESYPEEEGNLSSLEARKKRLIWRSKQRGWLEVDLLLGSWAVERVAQLRAKELDEYERFLNLETIDIFKVISQQLAPPPDLKDSKVVAELVRYAVEATLNNPQKYANLKKKMPN